MYGFPVFNGQSFRGNGIFVDFQTGRMKGDIVLIGPGSESKPFVESLLESPKARYQRTLHCRSGKRFCHES